MLTWCFYEIHIFFVLFRLKVQLNTMQDLKEKKGCYQMKLWRATLSRKVLCMLMKIGTALESQLLNIANAEYIVTVKKLSNLKYFIE